MRDSNAKKKPSPEVKMNGLETRTLELLRICLGKVEIVCQDRSLPGSPDFVYPASMLAIFVDGGWYHDTRGKMTRAALRFLASGDEQRADFWAEKARVNRARDRRVNRELRELGYSVVRLKEHRLNSRGALEYVSRSLGLALFKPNTRAGHRKRK